MRTALFAVMTLVLCGCGEGRREAAVAEAVTVEQAVARPLTAEAALKAAAVVASLPEGERPQFDPALSDIPIEGRRGDELASAYRRQFRAAINLPEQAERWRGRGPLTRACEAAGLDAERLALTLMQIGCAHHAGQVGRRVDLGDIRARTKTEIASLCDRLDAAPDLLTRRSLAESLRSSVALDTYLTLLDGVPKASREAVAAHRDELSAVLPQRAAMEIVPSVR